MKPDTKQRSAMQRQGRKRGRLRESCPGMGMEPRPKFAEPDTGDNQKNTATHLQRLKEQAQLTTKALRDIEQQIKRYERP